MLKTRPDNKIIIHWILSISVSIILLLFIPNKPVMYLFVSLINMSLIFNSSSYLKLNRDSLLITKNNFLFIPTQKTLINLSDITNLSLMDYRPFDINNCRKHVEFEAVVIVEAMTGSLFYKPNYILVIDLLQDKRLEFELNSDTKNVLTIVSFLQNSLTHNR